MSVMQRRLLLFKCRFDRTNRKV